MKLWPFFTFFGGKWRTAPHYPVPRYRTIVESFAGSAGYAVRYYDRRVLLCEAAPMLLALWRYLIRVDSKEIFSLPNRVDSVDDVHGPSEARALV